VSERYKPNALRAMNQGGENPMIKTHGVLHFTIPVKDLDRSEHFYKEIFGFERVRRNKHMVFLQSGRDNFVLTYSERPVDPNPQDGTSIHSAFRVTPEEYDHAMKFLAEKGIKILKEEERNDGTFQGRSTYFEDPDRNVLEIMDLRRGPVPEGQ
jgi:catechol 2,3-dioxygenase-like lactoylglutathione lyase family enzyme